MKHSCIAAAVALSALVAAAETFVSEIPLLESERWWGGGGGDGQNQPYGAAPRSRVDLRLHGNTSSPLLVSSCGRYVWSEIVANVFNCEVAVPVPGDASFGACLLAGVGIGLFGDVKDAVAKCLKLDRTISPDPSAAAKYERLFARYRAVHDALAPVYATRKD